jgi:hypothetical protein
VSALEIIAKVEDTALARNLVAALTAYGFHPIAAGDGGFPGTAPSGIPIRVPEGEAVDARALAEDLLKQMRQR